MNTARPFTFDDEFRDPARPAPRRLVETAEIERLVAEARAEGRASAEAMAAQAMASALGQVAQAVISVMRALDEEAAHVRAEAAELALAAAQRLAGEALAALPLEPIEAAVTGCLAEALATPEILVRVPAPIAGAAGERIRALAAEHGYEGRVKVAADHALKGADCTIQWGQGGATRDAARAFDEIAAAVRRGVAGVMAEAGIAPPAENDHGR